MHRAEFTGPLSRKIKKNTRIVMHKCEFFKKKQNIVCKYKWADLSEIYV